jgi:hypothetical protein
MNIRGMRSNMKLTIVVLLCASIIRTAMGAAGEAPAFAVGQTWKYATRAGEENSTLTVLAADADAKVGTIYHVAVIDLKLAPVLPATRAEPWEMTVGAFSAEALRRSVTTLEPTRALPAVIGFEKDYKAWLKLKAAGKHRYWELPVSEMIGQREAMIRQGKRS